MDINKVIEIIEKALEENLETILLMLIVVGSLNGINITLGTVIGAFVEKFNIKKFLFGILKAFITGCCIFVFCYTLNLFSLTLQLTKDITISTDFITTVEVFTILVTWGIDLAKDIIDKIKSMKQLKYVAYEDVTVQQNPEDSGGIG